MVGKEQRHVIVQSSNVQETRWRCGRSNAMSKCTWLIVIPSRWSVRGLNCGSFCICNDKRAQIQSVCVHMQTFLSNTCTLIWWAGNTCKDEYVCISVHASMKRLKGFLHRFMRACQAQLANLLNEYRALLLSTATNEALSFQHLVRLCSNNCPQLIQKDKVMIWNRVARTSLNF